MFGFLSIDSCSNISVIEIDYPKSINGRDDQIQSPSFPTFYHFTPNSPCQKAKSAKTQILFSLVIQHAYIDTESQIHTHKRNKQESVQHFTIEYTIAMEETLI